MPSVSSLEFPTDFYQCQTAIAEAIPEAVHKALWPDRGSDMQGKLRGYRLEEKVSLEDAEYALAVIERTLEIPCPKEVAAKAVMELKNCTIKTAATEPAAVEAMASYLVDLLDYPPDIVVSACRAARKLHKFWPSWAELEEQLNLLMDERRMMCRCLLNFIHRGIWVGS